VTACHERAFCVTRCHRPPVGLRGGDGWSGRHVEVVASLLRRGGKERMLFSQGDALGCLTVAAEAGHGHVVRTLWDAGGKELLCRGPQVASSEVLQLRQVVAPFV
jgi:hypothetical protein